MKPTWSVFWNAYPDYVTSSNSVQVKADIGGEVTAAWLGVNSCAIRMSRGFNYCGLPVPSNFRGLATVKGADKLNYAYRVAEFRTWMPQVLGAPDFDKAKKAGDAFDKSVLSAFKGIIAFDIHWSDATGHFDAWDGKTFSHESPGEDYWGKASRITLWRLM
jgi:hypothetical protein